MAQLGSLCVLCGVVLKVEAKKIILSCGDRTVARTVFVSGIVEPLLTNRPGSKSLGTKMSNNSFFSAANETLTTKCYFSMMDNDMESLSLNYLDHQ
jgi:hypothetical protein